MTKQELWDKVRAETCDCSPDEYGNCPCDYGFACDDCSAEWVQEVYKEQLKKHKLD